MILHMGIYVVKGNFFKYYFRVKSLQFNLKSICCNTCDIYHLNNEGDPPPIWYSVFRSFQTVHSMQRVGTQYATILLYLTQTSNFKSKLCSFYQETQENTRNVTYKVKTFRPGTPGVLQHMCFARQKHTCFEHIMCAPLFRSVSFADRFDSIRVII